MAHFRIMYKILLYYNYWCIKMYITLMLQLVKVEQSGANLNYFTTKTVLKCSTWITELNDIKPVTKRWPSAGSYRLLVPVEDVFFGEESHAVHQTHLTVALLSTNIDAFTLARTWAHPHNTHTHTYTRNHTHKAKQSTKRDREKPKSSC